jgi:hypothetical protein
MAFKDFIAVEYRSFPERKVVCVIGLALPIFTF